MAPRPNWKGYLKLSLVSCSVALYSATTTNDRIRFNIINQKTGNRVKYNVVDAETGDPVESEDRIKGYEIEKGNYILINDEELDEVALESTHTIDIDAFVPRDELDELYLDESYYIVPNDKVAYEAFAVIREAMKKENLVGLARVVLYRRERLLMLQPRGKGLMGTGLRYKSEVRSEDKYFDDIPSVKVPNDMLELAVHILKSKQTHFDPSQFEDRYEHALIQLIKAKQAGKAPPKAAEPPPSNVVNLMDALRRSVQAERKGETGSRSAGSSPAGRGRSRAASSGKKRAAGSKARVKRAS